MTDLIPLSAVLEARQPQQAASPERTDTLDKDAFLQLLVAQLRYQNPLSPSDPNQFMAQTAQFTMVEKLTELATHEARQRLTSETMVATSTLGKEISWLDDAGEEQSGVVTGTRFRATGPVLLVGDTEITLDQLLGVREASLPTTETAAAAPTESTEPTETPDVASAMKGGNLTSAPAPTTQEWRATYGPHAGELIPPGGFVPEPHEPLLRGFVWPEAARNGDFASMLGALIGSGQRIEVSPLFFDDNSSGWPPNLVRMPDQDQTANTTTNPNTSTATQEA